MNIGFSTGAVAFGDFRRGLELLSPFHLKAVELSALRDGELEPLIGGLGDPRLSPYEYIALHAPARFSAEREPEIIATIRNIADHFDAVIVHPDAMRNRSLWRELGENLCFENMDKRKAIGQTADHLSELFAQFPLAQLCFDIGHAWQVDRTMTEARQILRRFKNRIRQLHVSEVNTQSQHVPLSVATISAFRKVFDQLPDVPWILEAIVPQDAIASEIQYVRESFSDAMQLIPD